MSDYSVVSGDVSPAYELGVKDAKPTLTPTGRLKVDSSLSTEDKAALQKAGAVFRRAAAVSSTAGDGVLVTGVTTAGTVTLTLAGGGSVTIGVPLGSTVLPFSVIAAALGTAVGATFQSLFFA